MILTIEPPSISMRLRCCSRIDPTTNKGLLCSLDPKNKSSSVKDIVAQHGATFSSVCSFVIAGLCSRLISFVSCGKQHVIHQIDYRIGILSGKNSANIMGF